MQIFQPIFCVLGGFCLLVASCSSSGTVSKRSTATSAQFYRDRPALLVGNRAIAPPEAPPVVHRAIEIGNSLQNVPYQYGGGHGRPSYGLDCSGTVSCILRNCGLLRGAASSSELKNYGHSGPGRWITIYARDGHAFMTIAGLRLDTTGRGRTGEGPRWRRDSRKIAGFTMRHPPGL